MEKINQIIENHQQELEKVKPNIPVYESILAGTWRKEDELKALKSELSELDRNIALSLKPIEEEDESKEQKQENTKQEDKMASKPQSVSEVVTQVKKVMR